MDGTPLVLRLNYEGRFADRATSHSAVLSLSYAW
jgi:hypothetical protein